MHDVQTNIHSRNKIIVRSESHLLVQAVPLEQHGLEATLRSQAVLQVPQLLDLVLQKGRLVRENDQDHLQLLVLDLKMLHSFLHLLLNRSCNVFSLLHSSIDCPVSLSASPAACGTG